MVVSGYYICIIRDAEIFHSIDSGNTVVIESHFIMSEKEQVNSINQQRTIEHLSIMRKWF